MENVHFPPKRLEPIFHAILRVFVKGLKLATFHNMFKQTVVCSHLKKCRYKLEAPAIFGHILQVISNLLLFNYPEEQWILWKDECFV